MKPYFPKAFEKIEYAVFPKNSFPFSKVKEIMDKEHKCFPPNCTESFIKTVNRLLLDILTNPYHLCENILHLSNFLYSKGMGQYYVDSVLFHFCLSSTTRIPEISILLNFLHIEHLSFKEREYLLATNLLIKNKIHII